MLKMFKSFKKKLIVMTVIIAVLFSSYVVMAGFIGPGSKVASDTDRPLGTLINLLVWTNVDEIEIVNDCTSSTKKICLDADDDYVVDSKNISADESGSVIERLEWLIDNKID